MATNQQPVSSNQLGFTLLEMSIVLVIIALVIGGIFFGQTMIREAQLRSVLDEYDRYAKAIQEFQDKYQALPGDFSVAQNLWGSLTAGVCNGGTAVTALPTTTLTCNGDAGGTIGCSTAGSVTNTNESSGCGGGVLTVNNEWWTAWQHMANAGLIDGKFTGAGYTTTTTYANPGYNVPASRVTPGGWTLLYFLDTAGTVMWADNYGHILSFGAPDPAKADFTRYAIFTPAEALEIDTKLDDGMPGTGKVRAWKDGTNSTLTNCAIEGGQTQTTATYNTAATTSTAASCSLMFLLGM